MVSLTVRVDPPSYGQQNFKKIKTSYYECIWPETDFGKKIFFTIFDHFGLGIDACSTITRCLSLPKRDDK